jgi:hypothetical protein
MGRASIPQKVVPVLSYQGPVVPQRPAFNARRAWAWKGDHLFRVYLTPEQAWFIRIAGGQANAMTYQGGLLGALIAWWVNKRRKAKAARRVQENEDKPLEEMLAEHKRNHVIALADLGDPAIEAGGFWSGGGTAWTFKLPTVKRRVRCPLETTEDVEAAIRCLQPILPGLRVGVEFNERKKKFVKRKGG